MFEEWVLVLGWWLLRIVLSVLVVTAALVFVSVSARACLDPEATIGDKGLEVLMSLGIVAAASFVMFSVWSG